MTKNEPITTYISADVHELYRRSFVSEQTQTGYLSLTFPVNVTAEIWSQVNQPSISPSDREAAIIRFYEDIIAELQQEIMNYKAMVAESAVAREAEELGEHRPGQAIPLPPSLRQKWSSAVEAGLPLDGYEP